MRKIFSKKDEQNIITSKVSQILASFDKNNDSLLNERLKESEMHYRRLFEAAKDGILILDFETGKIVDANPYIINIIDCPLKKVIGKKLWEIGVFSNKIESELAFIELKKDSYIRFDNMPIQRPNGETIQVEFISNVYFVDNTKVIQCNIRNITERKQLERKQELTTKILTIINSQDNWKQAIHDILVEIKEYTGVNAIGIRLKEDEDYPYFETIGYTDCFMQVEKQLYSRNEKGKIIHCDKDNPSLDCMCGEVISGHTDSSLPHFTKGGSFYSGSSSELLNTTTENKRQIATLTWCKAEGYESAALIPLNSGKEIIGMLQLNDKSPAMFSIEMIQFFEKIGNIIGIAFNKVQNEKMINENIQNLRKQNSDLQHLNYSYVS